MTTVPDLQETPLSRFCHLVENVLKFLPLKDVCRSTRVSKIWQSCAVKVLRGRMRVEHTVFRKLDPHRLLHLCEAPEVKDFLENLYSKPRWAFVFGKISRNDLLSLKNLLPAETEVIGHIASAGVIGTTTGNRSREYQRPKHEAFSLISIPNLPGLEIFRFGFSQNQLNREMKGLDPTAVANNADLFGNLFGFSSDKQVKLLLLVSPSYIQFGHVNTIFRIFWMKGAGKVAFAGGVVEEVWKVEKTPGEIVGIVDDIGLTGIAFCGESVRAASAVIPEGKTTREEISTIFRKLAETGVGTGRLSFAFMFACCGRGKRLHKREDFEVAIFRQFFPHTPIQGIFSMGECGTDYLSTGNHTEEAEMPGAPQPFDTTFAYSTVVSVVSMQ